MWHVTHDTWHMTCDMWLGGEHSLNYSEAFMVWEWRCSTDNSTKDGWLNESMNHKGVCITAPAPPGLLIKLLRKQQLFGSQRIWNKQKICLWHMVSYYTYYIIYINILNYNCN